LSLHNQGAFGTITQPLNGTCTRDDVNISYTPNSDFCGVDQFTYTVTHPTGGADTATVTVLVLCPETTESDRPIANDDFATTSQGISVVLFVLSNDIFPPGKMMLLTTTHSKVCFARFFTNLSYSSTFQSKALLETLKIHPMVYL
jgi:hypothetical protein